MKYTHTETKGDEPFIEWIKQAVENYIKGKYSMDVSIKLNHNYSKGHKPVLK